MKKPNKQQREIIETITEAPIADFIPYGETARRFNEDIAKMFKGFNVIRNDLGKKRSK